MATAYGDAGRYLDYCEERGYDVTGLSPSPSTDIEQALLVGSEYIDGVYRSRFSGKRAQGRSQDREWPGIGATDAAGNAQQEVFLNGGRRAGRILHRISVNDLAE